MADKFEEIWSQYPKKLGKKHAVKHFKATVKTEQDYMKITFALEKYKKYLIQHEVQEQYIQHGSTWFNNWEDWLEYESPKKEIDYVPQSLRSFANKLNKN